jgi:hypothetical protein
MQRAWLLAIAATGLLACGSDVSVDPKDGECSDYCDLIGEHCLGANSQYGSRDACVATCAAMPLGDPEDRTGHTITCRTFTAATAELDPAATCTKAGPGGDGTCGMDCESFCAIADEICVDENAQFPEGDCLAVCAAFADPVPFSSNVTSGDSFACRLYHLTAASNDPDFHCPHIVADSETCD